MQLAAAGQVWFPALLPLLLLVLVAAEEPVATAQLCYRQPLLQVLQGAAPPARRQALRSPCQLAWVVGPAVVAGRLLVCSAVHV